MEAKGQILDIEQSFPDRKTLITVQLEADPADVEKLKGQELTVIMKKYRKSRSAEANRYYWELCVGIAEKLGISKTEVHNILLADYGQQRITEDGAFDWVVKSPSFNWTRSIVEHYKPVGQTIPTEYGEYPLYWVIRGSHTYNTAEMARLIDGAINEAEQLEIDPHTPDEIAEMMALYIGAGYGKTERGQEVRGGGAA